MITTAVVADSNDAVVIVGDEIMLDLSGMKIVDEQWHWDSKKSRLTHHAVYASEDNAAPVEWMGSSFSRPAARKPEGERFDVLSFGLCAFVACAACDVVLKLMHLI
jgi:hypothetical protein